MWYWGRAYQRGWIPAFLFTFLLLTACFDKDDYDFKKVAEVEWTPSYAAKILTGRMALTDLAGNLNNVELRAYPDGLLYFYFEKENESESIREIINFPDVSINHTSQSPIDISGNLNDELTLIETSFDVNLGITGGELDSVFYSQFPIDLIIETSIEEAFNLTFTFPAFTEGGTPLSRSLVKAAGENGPIQDENSFAEFIAALNTLDPAYNRFPVDLVLTLLPAQNITITEDDYLSVTLDIRNQGFLWVKGYFYPTSRKISQEVLEIDMFMDNFSNADFDLEGASITFEVDNEFGVPITLDFAVFDAINFENENIPVDTDPDSPFDINSPTELGESVVSAVSVVNPIEILKHRPRGFQYEVDALINDGIPTGRNFLMSTSKTKVKFTAEMPLWGYADGITLRDTFEISLNEDNDIDIDIADFTLRARIENGYPTDAFVQFILLDEDYQIIDTLLTEEQSLLVRAAETNDTEIVQNGLADEEILLDEDKINKLFDAKHILLLARLRTFTRLDGSQPSVKFFEDGYIQADLGIAVDVNMKLSP